MYRGQSFNNPPLETTINWKPDVYPGMTRSTASSSVDGSRLEHGVIGEVEWKPGKKEYAVMLTLALISLMVALDATILVSVLPRLATDLGGTATDAFWAGTSYLLSCAVCQPFTAALSDIFGRKEMLVVSVLFFTLGTVLCAPIAKDFTVFFVGRSIQGIGGGGIITMGQVIFADIVPLRQRPKYFSLVLAAWALGSVLGPLIGGLFVEHVIWPWCFYINFPFCALGLVLVPIYIKLKTVKTSLVSKLCRVDWVGGFFFIGGLTSFLVGISWAGIQFEWKSAQAVTPMIIGVVGVTIAIIWEIYGAREPFLRPSLFCSVSALATYACALFQGFILFCALYYIPFYFTAIRFQHPTQSGLDIFPVTCFLLPGSIVISLMTTRLGRYRWAIWSGWVVTALGCGLLALLDVNTKTPVWAVILAIFGIGHGMLLTSVNIGIQAVSRVEDAGRAAAMYAFMRTLGMSIGVAVGGTVFQNVMINKLNALGLPHSIAHNSEAYVKILAAMDPKDPERVAAVQAYLAGFHGVYWTITGAAIASFVISLIIRKHSMDKFLESKFKLKGARALPVPTASSPPVKSECRSMSAVTCLPPIFTFSPLSSPKASLHSSESTYAGSKQSQPSPTAQSQKPDAREQLGELQTGVQIIQPLHTNGQSQGVQTEDLESEHGSQGEADVIRQTTAVAYYIQPGGKVFRVVDDGDPGPKFDDGDPGPSTMREPVSASREHFNDEVYTSEGAYTSEEISSSEEAISSEEVISSEVFSSTEEGISSDEVIGSDEANSSQEDDRGQGVTHPDNKHFLDFDSSSPEQPPALGKHEIVVDSPALAEIFKQAPEVIEG